MTDTTNTAWLKRGLGELVLVIAGILIALQIDNWNDDRVEQRQIAEYARALVVDLERDLAMADVIAQEIDLLIQKIDALADYVDGRSIDEMRNIDLFYLMRRPYYRPYSWNRSTLEQIMSSGALRQMRNRELASRISEYAAFTRHLDDDFEFDRAAGSTAFSMGGRVVDMNYPDVDDLMPISRPEEFRFPDSEIHEAYAQLDRELLTTDVAELRIAVNAYLALGEKPGIRPRAEAEMPMLRAAAQELIDALKNEYPQ